MLKRIALTMFAFLTIGGLAVAGIWNTTFPIVGGASYCSSTVNNVCSTTVAAGPTALTGNETIPADTNLSGGSMPQTVLLTPRALNGAPITLVTCAAAACGSTTVGANAGGVMLSYSTTIDSATIVLPTAALAMQGQRISIGANYTVTSLTVTAGSGTTLSVTTPTVLTASTTAPQGYEYMLSGTVWYRVR